MSNTYSQIGAWAYCVYVSLFRERGYRKIPVFIWIIWGLLVLSIVGSFLQAQYYTMLVSVFALMLTFVPHVFTRKYKIYVPPSFMSAIVLFLYASIFLGENQGFYARFWWWDIMLHTGSAVGLGLVGFVMLLLLYGLNKMKGNLLMFSFFTFTFALAIGTLWEIFEFSLDQLLGLNTQAGGLIDTMWDLIADSIGALFASYVAFLYMRGKGAWRSGRFRAFIREAIEKNRHRNRRK